MKKLNKLFVVLFVAFILLANYMSIEKDEKIEAIIEEQINLDNSNVEVINFKEVPKRKKSAFIEWDDEEDLNSNHSTHYYNTPISDKINITLDDIGNHYQNPLTTFKVEENIEGVDFLCSCIRRGDIETLAMTLYELSKSGDTGEIYEFLDRKFNLTNLLFNYTY